MSNLHNELKVIKAAAESLPPPDKIGEILNLIARGDPFDKLFFDSLNDPSWLPLLDHCGYFSNLPSIKTMEDGKQFYPFHLPLFGLTRLATKAPQAVASILSRLKLSENPTVGDQVLRCVASIREPTCIPVLHPILIQLGQSPSRSSWVWIQELLKYWIETKAFSDVLVILNSYLIATASSTDRSPASDEWTIKQVDEIALGPLTPNYSLQIAAIVFNALAMYAELGLAEVRSDKQPRNLVYDVYLGEEYMSSFAVEDFTTLSNYQTFETILAHRLFLASDCIYRQGDVNSIEMLDQLLRSHSWNLFKRLRWQLYADFPELSLVRAQNDVLERIPFLNRFELLHYHEFARLLQVHALKSGRSFLSPSEVHRFYDVVINGPIEKDSDVLNDSVIKTFQQKQLWPISRLLEGEQAISYNALIGDTQISLRAYRPFRVAGFESNLVKSVLPEAGPNLGERSDGDLWQLFNNWEPESRQPNSKDSWVREDITVLAKQFAELLESKPERFLPEAKWWENLKRPEPLFEPLNRITERIQKKPAEQKQNPTSNDWANWFGLSRWIIIRSEIARSDGNLKELANQNRRPEWYWPRIVVSNFLTATIQSEFEEAKLYISEAGQLLRQLAVAEDSGLLGLEENQVNDWLATAINTVRGHAIEGILKLALRQKNSDKAIQPWIFEFICSRLNLQEESPAIFALIAANLRLFVYLFAENLKSTPNILYPPNRPFHERAAIVAHFCFDHPMTGILEAFPHILQKAVKILEAMVAEIIDTNEKQKTRDYASQLGIHIEFYYWNKAFKHEKDGEAVLDYFFKVANRNTREHVIRQIGWIFEKNESDQASPESKAIFERVMRLWEWRYGQIIEKIKNDETAIEDYEGELAGFLNWIICECFPFDWRFNYAMQAIDHLKEVPDIFHILEMVQQWNESKPDRLNLSLQFLVAILSRPSDQLRWQIQIKTLGPLLVRGLSSDDQVTQQYATDCQDLLLKMGLFEFLDLNVAKSNE